MQHNPGSDGEGGGGGGGGGGDGEGRDDAAAAATIRYNGRTVESRRAIDFIDLGGSGGGSYQFMRRRFGFVSGLSIDIDPKKVALALQRGIPALQLDATHLSIFTDGCCRAVSMLHFLEHLPDMDHVRRVLAEAVRVSSDLVYIRGPPFHDDYLGARGLRYYWAHWRGHSVHVEAEDIVAMLRALDGVRDVQLTRLKPVASSEHPCIQSVRCAIDRHAFDAAVDPPKPRRVALEGAYEEYEIVARVRAS